MLDRVLMVGLWSSTLSFLAISFFKLYGLLAPFSYHAHITIQRCLALVVACWLLPILSFLAITAMEIASPARSQEDWMENRGNLVSYVHRGHSLLVVAVYAGAIGCYLVTGEWGMLGGIAQLTMGNCSTSAMPSRLFRPQHPSDESQPALGQGISQLLPLQAHQDDAEYGQLRLPTRPTHRGCSRLHR